MHTFGLAFPYRFTLLLRTLGMLETICIELQPEFNLVEYLKPYIKKLLRKQYSLEKLIMQGKKIIHETVQFLDIAPEEFALLLKKARKGELKLNFRHQGLDHIVNKMDDAIDDIAFSVIIASLVIGSSLVMTIDKGPQWLDYPLLGVIGYILSAGLGLVFIFRLLYRSLKR